MRLPVTGYLATHTWEGGHGSKPQLLPLFRGFWMPLEELPGGVRPTGKTAPCRTSCPAQWQLKPPLASHGYSSAQLAA